MLLELVALEFLALHRPHILMTKMTMKMRKRLLQVLLERPTGILYKSSLKCGLLRPHDAFPLSVGFEGSRVSGQEQEELQLEWKAKLLSPFWLKS